MSRRFDDLSGKRFGRLLVVSPSHVDKGGNRHWHCVCDCGANAIVPARTMKLGRTVSCGCYRCERSRTHHMSTTSEYRIWADMRGRCERKSFKQFKDYGGRGIAVCDRWQRFEKFYEDMGPRPGPEFSLDRINVNGNYEPGNVRWATDHVQRRNRRDNNFVEFGGKRLCLADWAREANITSQHLRGRLKGGWPFSLAISTPKGVSFEEAKRTALIVAAVE